MLILLGLLSKFSKLPYLAPSHELTIVCVMIDFLN